MVQDRRDLVRRRRLRVAPQIHRPQPEIPQPVSALARFTAWTSTRTFPPHTDGLGSVRATTTLPFGSLQKPPADMLVTPP